MSKGDTLKNDKFQLTPVRKFVSIEGAPLQSSLNRCQKTFFLLDAPFVIWIYF